MTIFIVERTVPLSKYNFALTLYDVHYSEPFFPKLKINN